MSYLGDISGDCDHPGILLLESLLQSPKFQQLTNAADEGHAWAQVKMQQIADGLQSLVFYLENTEVGDAEESRVNYELDQFQDLVREYLE